MTFEKFKNQFPSVLENEPMARHTSFRIGGAAKFYVVASSSDELVRTVEVAHELDMPFFLFGGGSNLLVADGGYDGLIIQAGNRSITVVDDTVRAEAGAITALVARQSVDARLTGFEWAVGVPGTIGGATYGNAGCFGGEMKDAVMFVEALRLKDRERVRLSNTECRFGYRESFFKHEPHLILGIEMKLKSCVGADGVRPPTGAVNLTDILQKRKESQPLGSSSCGCVFKNFAYEDESALDILKRHVEIPSSMLANRRISAGWLIEQVGMMGQRVGGIEVSDKHGNFFLNTGQATAQDVVALISLIKMKVRDKFWIELEEEVQMLGF